MTTVDVNAAGVILFCNTPHGPRFLLVLNKWGDRAWGFPKGHIDKADNGVHLVTALRETREETGFAAERIRIHHANGKPVEEIGRVVYAMPRPTRNIPSGVKHVAFFLGEIQPMGDGITPPEPTLSKEHTAAQWFPLDEVVRLVREEYGGVLGVVKSEMATAQL